MGVKTEASSGPSRTPATAFGRSLAAGIGQETGIVSRRRRIRPPPRTAVVNFVHHEVGEPAYAGSPAPFPPRRAPRASIWGCAESAAGHVDPGIQAADRGRGGSRRREHEGRGVGVRTLALFLARADELPDLRRKHRARRVIERQFQPAGCRVGQAGNLQDRRASVVAMAQAPAERVALAVVEVHAECGQRRDPDPVDASGVVAERGRSDLRLGRTGRRIEALGGRREAGADRAECACITLLSVASVKPEMRSAATVATAHACRTA